LDLRQVKTTCSSDKITQSQSTVIPAGNAGIQLTRM